MKSKLKVLFAGGGTGGHVFPVIAIVREINKLSSEERKGRDFEFHYFGPKDDFAGILLSQESIRVKYVLAGKIRRYFSFKSVFSNVIDVLFKIPIGLLQAFSYIFVLAPDIIVSEGGFGSFPTVVAGWILGVPVFLHESDAIPGLANRMLGKFSTEIFVSFPKTPYFEKKMLVTGNPIRRELLSGSRQEALQHFKIAGDRPVVLIIGGSQGSQRINDRVLEILPDMLEEFEVIHQCGEKNVSQVFAEAKVVVPEYRIKHYHAVGFLKEDELEKAYAASDIIVSRAGAGMIFEIAALAKPSILIPLPESAQNHQVKNAYGYAQRGAAMVIEEGNFSARFFLEKLRFLFSNPGEIEKMKAAAKEFSKPLAAKIIAGYIVVYLTKEQT